MFIAILIAGLVLLTFFVVMLEYLAQHISGFVYTLLITLAFTSILIGIGGMLYEREQILSRNCTEGYVYHDGICVQGYKP